MIRTNLPKVARQNWSNHPQKIWNVPDFIKSDLKRMNDEFLKKAIEKIEGYKSYLRNCYGGPFKDVPQDAFFDFRSGTIMATLDQIKKAKEESQKK